VAAPAPRFGDVVALDGYGTVTGLAAAGDGDLWVATASPAHVLRVAPPGVVVDGFDLGDRAIAGIAVGEREVAVVDVDTDTVVGIDIATGRARDIAALPDVEGTGPVDAAPEAVDVTLGPSGSFLVTDGSQGVIWRVTDTGEVSPWHQDIDYTSPRGLAGIAGAPDGAVVFVAADALRVPSLRQDRVFRTTVSAEGGSEPREQVAQGDLDDALDDLAVLADGSIAVTVPAGGAVAVFAPDGTPAERVTDGLTRPVAVAALGDRLVVADQPDDGPVRLLVLGAAA
jgi:hypothetical protein